MHFAHFPEKQIWHRVSYLIKGSRKTLYINCHFFATPCIIWLTFMPILSGSFNCTPFREKAIDRKWKDSFSRPTLILSRSILYRVPNINSPFQIFYRKFQSNERLQLLGIFSRTIYFWETVWFQVFTAKKECWI